MVRPGGLRHGYVLLALLLACTADTPAIDGILDCDGGEDVVWFEVADVVGERSSVPLDQARDELNGLEPADEVVHAGPGSGEPSDAKAGDLVVIRDGHEIAWFRTVGGPNVWNAQAGSACPGTEIRLRELP